MSKSNEAIFVESAVTPGTDIRQDIAEEIGDQRTYTLMGAALALSVAMKFPQGSDSDEIQSYISQMRNRFPEGTDSFKPDQLESIIRGIRGEVELLDDVDPNYMAEMSFMLPYAIITQDKVEGEALDDFVDQVVELANAN